MKHIVSLEEAIGFPLAHDITEIVPGEFKGAAFHKGHILKVEDLDHLRRLGKNHLYIISPEEGEMHEDAAALLLAESLCGEGVGWNETPREGKITLVALIDGLLKVDIDVLHQFNMFGEFMCATRHTNSLVKKGDVVAATRAIPLMVDKTSIDSATSAARGAHAGVLKITSVRMAKVGIMITGNEVYNGLIEDKFKPVISKKVIELGGEIVGVRYLPDDEDMIVAATFDLISAGADLLITTGGMSVDPDDRTRFALTRAGIDNVVYGTPVLPGAMFMVAYLGDIPVLGVPACGMYAARTVLDLLYPRILAGEKLSRTDIASLGHGGLCLNCPTCHFPVCPFGK